MANQTALELITASLKRLGVISGIETPTADLAADGLARLNELVETWSTESLSMYHQSGVIAICPASPPGPIGFTFYTVGPGGTFDTGAFNRPSWIDSVSWILPGTPPIEFKLKEMLKQEWEALPNKMLTSTQPTHFVYGPFWPLGELDFWPRPSISNEVWLYIPQALKQPATLSTVLSLPQGYARALRDCLALELAPEVGRPIDAALAQSAIEAKAQLQRVNFRPRTLEMPDAIATSDRGGYDWRTD